MCAQAVGELKSKICFVIAPVGDDGSEVRIRSDKVLKHIIAPAATACGYQPLRADKISKPGIITSQVIQHLIDDPLVIADLTGPNANVFYELAIRHAFRKPVVQIIDAAESIPFDLAASRTIKFDYRDLDSAEQAKEEIKRQIKAVEENPNDVDNPLTQAVELQSLRQSGNPLEKSTASIMAMLQDLRAGVNEIQRNMIKPLSAGEAIFTKRLQDMIFGQSRPKIEIDPATFEAMKTYLQARDSTTSSETDKDK